MFLMINIVESQRDYLRFLWKEHPGTDGPPKVYRFKVLPFGLNCTLYLAIRTMQDHLSALKELFPAAEAETDERQQADRARDNPGALRAIDFGPNYVWHCH